MFSQSYTHVRKTHRINAFSKKRGKGKNLENREVRGENKQPWGMEEK